MTVRFDPQTDRLRFDRVLPGVRSRPGIVADLKQLIDERSSRTVPSHKRLDRRRAIVTASVRQGDWSLAVAIRGSSHEYATRLALNLINEIFLLLHERYPDYLVQEFGFVDE